MTKKQIMELYGKSVYNIRLELAVWHYHQGDTVEEAFVKADEFVSHMLSHEHKPEIVEL